MLDGHLLVDVHQHTPRRSTIKPAWKQWAHDFGEAEVTAAVYPDGDLVSPEGYAQVLRAEGVDVALTIAEYSPKATGIQPIEDLLPLAEHAPGLVRVIGNVNPHLHFPVEDEVQRQVDLGAVAIKIHPVHGGFAANDRALYAAYARCQELRLPVVVHCGTSSFPGSSNALAAPELLDDVLRDFRTLSVVLAHGGRGWWYDAAAFLALSNEHVWIELSGLPPSRLREYYARHNWNRLVRRMIFGTDWPGVPGIAANARAIAALCPSDEVVAQVLGGNAVRVYGLKDL